MRVLGTAGHVDHGKSTLVQALTGINPDRLREEQERQMTIDLGFAWMRLPGGEEIGLVDVPGHRDFIENMLAGITGIDAAILVVAADEGVMPQTREHLAILDLLEVPRAVVALTKVDLVEDDAWLDLVREEVRQLLQPTGLAGAPIIPVSAVTRRGLDELVSALAKLLSEVPSRPDHGRPRLPIDRAFTMPGFGTIVTGTLADGALEVGQEVEIVPGLRRGRIRGLQTHRTKVERAVPGSRTAANLVGLEVRELSRGDVVALPRTYPPAGVLDVRFRLLADATAPLRHDQRVKLFLGTAQRLARVRLLGADQLAPGEEGWLQLVLGRPVAAARGDHFILRRPSPGATLGGGRVADSNPKRFHRRRDAALIERLEGQLRGTPAQVLAQALVALGPATLREAVERTGLDLETARQALDELRPGGRVLVLGSDSAAGADDALLVEESVWGSLIERTRSVLGAYHQANPVRKGMPREEFKSRLRLESRVFTSAMSTFLGQNVVVERAGRVSLPEHRPTLNERQGKQVEALLAQFRAGPYNTPSVKECQEAVGEEILGYLLDGEQLVRLSPEVLLEGTVYQETVARVRQELKDRGTITVAQVRDLFGTSRKYALALMEHLDAIGTTVREGDARRLSKGQG